MSRPPIRKSDVLNRLRVDKDKIESERTRSKMLLAARIIHGYKAKNWNRVEFARQMNQKPSVVTKWLSGSHNFTTDTLFDIERVLGISLINYREDNKPGFMRGIVIVNTMNTGTLNFPLEREFNPLRMILTDKQEIRFKSGTGIIVQEYPMERMESLN